MHVADGAPAEALRAQDVVAGPLRLAPEQGGEGVLRDVPGLGEFPAKPGGGLRQAVALLAQGHCPVEDGPGVSGTRPRGLAPSRAQERGVEAVQETGVDLGEAGRADVVDDVQPDVAGVRVEPWRGARSAQSSGAIQ